MDIEHVKAGADHIVALEPLSGPGIDQTLSMVWAVGRRCNFACSYCTTEFHDRVSPHRSFEEFRKVWDNIKKAMFKRGLVAASIEFTGGEATMNPDFLPFIRYLSQTQRSWIRSMGLTSNGSESLGYYQRLAEHLDWLCFSTHFEWWDENHFMTMLLDLKRSLPQQRQSMLTVNVMYEEWSAKILEKVKKIIEAEGIRNTPLKIYNIYGSKGIVNKSSTPFDYETYLKGREATYTPTPPSSPAADENPPAAVAETVQTPPEEASPAPSAETSAPPPVEKTFSETLLEHCGAHNEVNTKITLNDGSNMWIHSQVLINLRLNSFPGWKCHAGMDRIFINVDGKVYGGMCRVGELGHMLDELNLAEQPVECDGRNCHCMSDLLIKKWGSSGVQSGSFFKI